MTHSGVLHDAGVKSSLKGSKVNTNVQHRSRTRQASHRFPPVREKRTSKLSADELISSLEWFLRNRPRSLRVVRNRYHKFCVAMLAQIERACRELCDADWEKVA